ncbi:MAG: hypothetical protein HON04_16845 [Planctomicrobium sp.]|jgi:hypothetical protein|nr:hypothetical protein [Planctomicrobium sp.]
MKCRPRIWAAFFVTLFLQRVAVDNLPTERVISCLPISVGSLLNTELQLEAQETGYQQPLIAEQGLKQ